MSHVRGRYMMGMLRRIPNCTPTIFNTRKTKRRVIGLLAWARAESGNGLNDGQFGPSFNPICTTWPWTFPPYNSVGVRNFPDFPTGVTSTVATLNLPGHNYEPIIAALQAADLKAIVAAIAQSQWGTGDGALNALLYTQENYKQEFMRPVGSPA